MEDVHGVDVSWCHNPHKEHHHRKTAPSSPGLPKDAKPPTSSHGGIPANQQTPQRPTPEPSKYPSPAQVTPPALSEPQKDTTTAVSSTPSPGTNGLAPKTATKRPSLLSRSASDDGRGSSRRASWMSNISSKFSSSAAPSPPPQRPAAAAPQQLSRSPSTNGAASAGSVAKSSQQPENVEPYVPSKPKDSTGFFSNLTRRLSSASQTTSIPKVQGNGGVCPRMVLNVDPNRQRCLVPEMDQSKLRRVSFCVDVEIASGPRYKDDGDDDSMRMRKRSNVKMKERAEGEALKHPEALVEEKESENEGNGGRKDSKTKPLPVPGSNDKGRQGSEDKDEDGLSASIGSTDGSPTTSRKKEKKKRSEAERKERKEKRIKRAQESGSIPLEMLPNDDNGDTSSTSTPPSLDVATPAAPASVSSENPQDRPTTDPARIYRRCCQLRETPILKRITEQLMSPRSAVVNEPGVVATLDLTGSRLQLADVVTLGDWLAVVPVKRLLLEDADLNDEGVRVVLAGLLAATKPTPSKRKSPTPKHREVVGKQLYEERSGMVEKISLKNNPRVSRAGWKHISLFIYLCRSVKAIDISMNKFPPTIPASNSPAVNRGHQRQPSTGGSNTEVEAAEILYKCLSERLAGSRLEELSLSECGLQAPQIRKIIDGAVMCGVSRLGLAGNHLDDEGLQHVVHYLRSGVCQGLDLGGNDLRGKLDIFAQALNDRSDIPCWGLSLAGCNLDTQSLKPLLPALVKLPNFRFIDLSHNRDLCGVDNGTISMLRRYLGQMKDLKRIHLSDVGMSSKQAIALAEVLPEGPRLAHLSILENPQLTALANSTDEAGQEEACALYASLMAAVRVSNTLICIDIDVPSQDCSEVVKALAKQVVAYSLRNMEQFAIAEATGDVDSITTANAAATLTAPHGGEKQVKEVVVPDVLAHLVGHGGPTPTHDDDDPAPDDDYIVGGTGVVKALQYVLGEKANDLRRGSAMSTSGTVTPRERPGSSAGIEQEGTAKAKQMSRNLLESARKIQTRLQPALMKEATAGDEMAYRRLLFLDQTLQSMIQRFEEEYPETRLPPPLPKQEPSLSSSVESHVVPIDNGSALPGTEEDYEDDASLRPAMIRHNSDASLASRALTLEEGRLHRLGQHLRREVVDSGSNSPTGGKSSPINTAAIDDALTNDKVPVFSVNNAADDDDNEQAIDGASTATSSSNSQSHINGGTTPSPSITTTTSTTTNEASADPDADAREAERLRQMGENLYAIPGLELKELVEKSGWDELLRKFGANFEDLRHLQEQDPEGWEQFRDSHLKSRENRDLDRDGPRTSVRSTSV